MERNYTDGVKNNVTFFVGNEVEHTPAFGMRTLFVVGVHDAKTIIDIIEKDFTSWKDESKNVKHIYFGANQSFKTGGVNDYTEWNKWENMIKACIDAGYWCTLDIDVSEIEGLVESGLSEYRRFIPMISVKVPYLEQLNYNATIKIDDKGFEASNPGVWCHSVHALTNRETFTSWDKYTQDIIIRSNDEQAN
jgi:hypothetical protein